MRLLRWAARRDGAAHRATPTASPVPPTFYPEYFMAYARLESDVNLDEEEELRRAESGLGPRGASTRELLFEHAATVKGQGEGTIFVFPTHLEWTADNKPEPDITVPVADMLNFQATKPETKKSAKLKMILKEGKGGPHIFDLSGGVYVSTMFSTLYHLRDLLVGLQTGNSAASLASHGAAAPSVASSSGPRASVSPVPAAAGSKRPLAQSDGAAGGMLPPAKRPAAPVAPTAPAAPASSAAAPSRASQPPAPRARDDGMTIAEREMAEAVMRSDPEVRRLFEELVTKAGALTPAEFWAQRRGAMYAAAQQQGFATRPFDETQRKETVERIRTAETEAAAAAAAEGSTNGSAGAAAAAAAAGRSTVHMRLTVAMKHRIFADYPDIHQMFLEVVPHQMPERTFWMRYFRSKTRNQNAAMLNLGGGAAVAGASGSASGGQGGQGTSAGGSSDADAMFLNTGARAKPPRVFPDTNLEAEEVPSSFHSGGYGLAEPAAAVVGFSASELRREKASERGERERRDREYNSHGRVVIDGVDSGAGGAGGGGGGGGGVPRGGAASAAASSAAGGVSSVRRGEARKAWVALPDLQEEAPVAFAPLPGKLQARGPGGGGAAVAAGGAAPKPPKPSGDAAGSSDGGGAASEGAGAAAVDTVASRAALAAWLRTSYVPSRKAQPLPVPDAADVLAVCTGAAAPMKPPAGSASAGASAGAGAAQFLPPKIEALLTEKQERAMECLRYFHACYPLTQVGAKDRAGRLHTALRAQRDELMRFKASLPPEQPQMRTTAERRINSLLDMVFAAVHRYEQSTAAAK